MPVVLDPGLYLAKATFIAEGGDSNFWSRVFTFDIPTRPSAPAANPLGG